MNIKPYVLTFDVTKKDKTKLILKQYDSNTRLLQVNLTQFGEPLSLLRTVDAYFYAVKPDGYKIFNPAKIINYEDGQILITLTNQALMAIGSLKCELVLKDIDKEQHLSSFPFTIVVSESCYSDEAHESMHQDGAFDALAKKVDDAIFGNIDLSNYYNIDEINTMFDNIQVDTIEYTTSDDPSIKSIKDALDKLLYSPLSANLSLSRVVAERGEQIQGLKVTWNFNKSSVVEQTLNGQPIDKENREFIDDTTISTNKSYRLIANDGKGTIDKSVNIAFYNGRYHGVSSSTDYNSDFIKGLVKTLSDNKGQTITVNCLSGQYIYYCIPTRLGTPVFTVQGFTGGFDKISTIGFTNSYGFTENYDIWKSTNSGLGNTTINIT